MLYKHKLLVAGFGLIGILVGYAVGSISPWTGALLLTVGIVALIMISK